MLSEQSAKNKSTMLAGMELCRIFGDPRNQSERFQGDE
jgi:hypothetical protein